MPLDSSYNIDSSVFPVHRKVYFTFSYYFLISGTKSKKGGEILQLKKIIIVFAILVLFVSFGAYTTTSFQTTMRQAQNGEVVNWHVFDINNTTTDGGGDDVPGGGIPK